MTGPGGVAESVRVPRPAGELVWGLANAGFAARCLHVGRRRGGCRVGAGVGAGGCPARAPGYGQPAFATLTPTANNDFLAISQFRMDEPGSKAKRVVAPDVVLFVNGIPLVVIECKSPYITDPMAEGN
jgi:Type I restriction enzyme R protein N terminus (HSDR_N)